MFENTRSAEMNTNMNELAEKSWQEIQTAFGSAISASGSLSVPIGSITLDAGASMDHMDTSDLGFKNSKEKYAKAVQS